MVFATVHTGAAPYELILPGVDCAEAAASVRKNGLSMKFRSPGLELESATRQRILRVAITIGMGAAQGLISAVMLVLAMSCMAVQGHAVLVSRQEDCAPAGRTAGPV